MIDEYDVISLFGNDKLRSSYFIDYVWKIIEDKIIYVVGMTNSSNITIFIDNDTIIFSATSNYNAMCIERFYFTFDHVLTLTTDLCISLTINFISSSIKKINYDMCSFYYEIENKEDEGTIEIYCDAYYNIETYRDFKTEITMQLAKELQYLIHRNILDSNIEVCNVAKIDAIFETVNMFSKINNMNFLKSASLLFSNNKIHKEDYEKICKIKEEVNHGIKQAQQNISS